MSQTNRITPFTGTWRLNLSKSTFKPGPPFKSFTITFTGDGTRDLYLVGADGEALNASLPWSDGREVAVGGMKGTMATSKIRGDTFDDIWKHDGKIVEQVHGELSAHGATLTIKVEGTSPQGHSFRNRLVFSKE